MSYRRCVHPPTLATGDTLTAAMAGIGMGFAVEHANGSANIEDTVLAASVEGMERDQLRVLAILTTWCGIHSAWVNADRLTRLVASAPGRVRAFWSSMATWMNKDRRVAKLAGATDQHDLLRVGTEFHVDRAGEDPRFQGGPLRVPANVLRDRPEDVLTPIQLARRHSAYRHRVQSGPSYRADMWAALEQDPALTATQLARGAYGSFATAWHVKADWEVLHAGDESDAPARRRA